jgi:endonuclease YncB( thermonuclease family)
MAGEIQFRLDKIKKDLNDRQLAKVAYDQFVLTTPIRSGNARDRTGLKNNVILANYPYAQRLDDGYSRQAPKGMTEPTLKHVQQYIKRQENK